MIKAIETVYKGYKFRSRLEARWAVFFDALGLQWEYEPQGFCNGKAKYLPDFYIKDWDAYVEVKPQRPGFNEEIQRALQFITYGGPIKRLVILGDIPSEQECKDPFGFVTYYYSVMRAEIEARCCWIEDKELEYLEGVAAQGIYYRFDKYDEENKFPFYIHEEEKPCIASPTFYEDECGEIRTYCVIQKWYRDEDFEPVRNAINKARQARFEHGECG